MHSEDTLMSVDADLTGELVRLLGDELQRVRNDIEEVQRQRAAQREASEITASATDIQALRDENQLLKTKINDIKTELSRYSQLPRDDGDSDKTQSQELQHDAAIVRAETERVLRDKIRIARAEYCEAKSRSPILGLSRENYIRLEAEARQEQEQLLTTQSQLVSPSFDFRGFIRSTEWEEAHAPEAIFRVSPQQGPPKLPKTIADLCVEGGYRLMQLNELRWPSGSRRKRCLAFEPVYSYNPSAEANKKWSLFREHSTPPEADLFHQRDETQWVYVGTFQRVGLIQRPASEFRSIASKDYMAYIQTRTITSPNLVPPIIVTLIEDMYKQNVLNVACTGWQWTGYNQDLANELLRQPRPAAIGPPTVIPIPKVSTVRVKLGVLGRNTILT